MSHHKTSILWTLTKEELLLRIEHASSAKDLLLKLGYTAPTAAYKRLKERLVRDGIPWPTKWAKGSWAKHNLSKSLPEILVEGNKKVSSGLKQRLIREGLLDNYCQKCDQGSTWRGEPLVLVLDHINGVNDDWRLENLRLLCPNCNSQEPTFCGRNIKAGRATTPQCVDCGVVCSKGSSRCLDCYNSNARVIQSKINWPEKEDLEKLVSTPLPIRTLAANLGVTDNALRSHCAVYGIEIPKIRRKRKSA